MAQGRIEQAASAREIFVAPRNAYVARFIGGQNVLSGTVESMMNGTAAVAGDNGARFAFPVGDMRPARGSPSCGARSAATASPSRRCRPAPSRPAG